MIIILAVQCFLGRLYRCIYVYIQKQLRIYNVPKNIYIVFNGYRCITGTCNVFYNWYRLETLEKLEFLKFKYWF